tara:strand:+ start:22459 stop:23820 length:1362 start_codon:yes stop_codon:yes gene_type:complete
MFKKVTIFLPVETFSRELPYKAPLAVILASFGYKVLIGRQQELRLYWFNRKKFFYIDKSSAKTKFNLYQDIKNCGGGIGVFCEEGLVYRTKKQYISERVFKKSFELIDIFWCWGNRQYNDLSGDFNPKKLKIIDSPRLAIINNIKDKYISKVKKKNILFLTSFGRSDKNTDSKLNTQLKILKSRGTYNPNIGEYFYEDWEKYNINYKKEFLDLIKLCAKSFPEINFEIRVHPTEMKDKYSKLVKRYNNITFSKFSTSLKSIVNNDIVVSPISTTAIESTLINNKSIVYAPKYDSRFEPNLITDSCKLIRKKSEVIAYIREKHMISQNSELGNSQLSKFMSMKENDSQVILKNYALSIIHYLEKISYEPKISNIYIRFKYFLKSNFRNILYSLKIKKEKDNISSKCFSIKKHDIIKYVKDFMSDNDEFNDINLKYNFKRESNNIYEISSKQNKY